MRQIKMDWIPLHSSRAKKMLKFWASRQVWFELASDLHAGMNIEEGELEVDEGGPLDEP